MVFKHVCQKTVVRKHFVITSCHIRKISVQIVWNTAFRDWKVSPHNGFSACTIFTYMIMNGPNLHRLYSFVEPAFTDAIKVSGVNIEDFRWLNCSICAYKKALMELDALAFHWSKADADCLMLSCVKIGSPPNPNPPHLLSW